LKANVISRRHFEKFITRPEGDVPAVLRYAGVMSSFGYASEGDVFLFSSASLRKQKGDVQAQLAVG
jgi:hypothetical protein